MLSKRNKVYQTNLSMSTGLPLDSSPGPFGTKSQFGYQSQLSPVRRPTSNGNVIQSPRRRCDSEIYVKSATESSNVGMDTGQTNGQQPPQPRARSSRPKMGVPAVVTRTSTPKSEISPKSPKFRKSDFDDRNDEPIYCEIVTPGKTPKKSSNNQEVGPKSPNSVRNGYLSGRQQQQQQQQPLVFTYSSKNDLKSPNFVRNSYIHSRQQSVISSNNSEFEPKNSSPVRNGFLMNRQSSVNSNNYEIGQKPSNNIRNNFLFGRQQSVNSNNSDETPKSPKTIRSAFGLSKPPPPTSNWSQRYRVADSQPRNIMKGLENGPSSVFRSPKPVPTGLGRRAQTQLDIPNSRWRATESTVSSVRCPENPSSQDSIPTFERHRWERHSVNSEATSCSLASYGDEGDIVIEARATLLKGVMWLQREKVFSRWKERFFVLTKDYLQCFKKSTSLITEMGGFVFRVRLCEIDELELIVRRGYLTISLATPKTGKLLLRKPDGIRRWYQIIQECVASCKERQEAEREKNRFWMRKQLTDSSSMDAWIQSRRLKTDPSYANWTDTGSCISETLTGTLISNNPMEDRKSLETTDYGFIDGPVRRLLSYQRGTSNRELKSIDERMPASNCQSPSSAMLVRKAMMTNNKSSEATASISTTFSRDSGIDSMNAANSPGSILSTNSSHVTTTSMTPSRAQTDSPTDLASNSFSYCDNFSRKITLV